MTRKIAHDLGLAILLLAAMLTCVNAADSGSPGNGRVFDAEPVSVTVDIAGSRIHVEASVLFAAPQELVWKVITDFEHMPRFISNLVSSEVLERSEHRVLVVQKGKASFGPISFEFDSEREILLYPMEKSISKMLRGNVRSYTGTTLLRAEGTSTRLSFSSDTVTDAFLAPVISKRFIENESREQFTEFRAEVHKRQHDNLQKL